MPGRITFVAVPAPLVGMSTRKLFAQTAYFEAIRLSMTSAFSKQALTDGSLCAEEEMMLWGTEYLSVPDVGEHDFKELLGREDPLGSAGSGSVQGAGSSHHAVCAAQICLCSFP